MSKHELAGATALVTGASRGFGRSIATALSRAGAQVVGVARDRAPLEALRAQLGASFTAVSADAADPTVAGQFIDAYDPRILVLNAGAKATQRFITAYAQQEASRAGLGITFTAVLPRIAPATGVGGPAVRAYAARTGQSEEAYLQQLGGPLTPEQAGQAVVELVTGAAGDQDAYLLSAAGLGPLP